MQEQGWTQLQTLWYRSPEVLFGSLQFGPAIDVWSLGLVLAEVFGLTFHTKAVDETGHARGLFQGLGTPGHSSITKLPAFPKKVAPKQKPVWPASVTVVAGSPGTDLLDGSVAWDPDRRLDARALVEHPFVHPERLLVYAGGGGGASCQSVASSPLAASGAAASTPTSPRPVSSDFPRLFAGKRHDSTMVHGVMSAELLQWLRRDPGLDMARLGAVFSGSGHNYKTEEGRKFIRAGPASTCASKSMCALSLRDPFPLQRVVSWFAAFRAVNAETLASLSQQAKAVVKKLPAESLGENGQQFLNSPLGEWLLTCGELCVTYPGSEAEGFWAEPRHQDGGGSVLHLGLTLFGRRQLRCEQHEGLADVVVNLVPGSVYVGTLTGPWHQVTHQQPMPGDAFEGSGDGVGRSVTVMLRCALFAANRSRTRNTTPSPQPFFHGLVASFNESLLKHRFRLPSLQDVLAAHSETVSEVAVVAADAAAGALWNEEGPAPLAHLWFRALASCFWPLVSDGSKSTFWVSRFGSVRGRDQYVRPCPAFCQGFLGLECGGGGPGA